MARCIDERSAFEPQAGVGRGRGRGDGSRNVAVQTASPETARPREGGRGHKGRGFGHGGGRTRRLPHAREPFLRPLLRHVGRGERIRRRFARLRPGMARRSGFDLAPVPPRHPELGCRVHLRPVPLVAGRARLVEPRRHGLVCLDPHVEPIRGPDVGPVDDGLLRKFRHPLLLRPDPEFHRLRQLLLLGPRTHSSQPDDADDGNPRPHRRKGWAHPHHQQRPRRGVDLLVDDDARDPPGRRRVLEGLQPTRAELLYPRTRTPCSCARTSSCTSSNTG